MNPERTNFMDIMPIYRQRHYAIVASFDVEYGNHKDFEFFIKDTIRYYQQLSGYLFSHVLRQRDYHKKMMHYYLIQTWTDMKSFKTGFHTAYREELTRSSKCKNGYVPQVMKIVADDFEYVPPPSKKQDDLERRGLRTILDVPTSDPRPRQVAY